MYVILMFLYFFRCFLAIGFSITCLAEVALVALNMSVSAGAFGEDSEKLNNRRALLVMGVPSLRFGS